MNDKQKFGGELHETNSSHCKFYFGYRCDCGIRARADSASEAHRLATMAHVVLKPLDNPLYGTVDIPASMMKDG